LGAEVQHISSHGFWVFLETQNRELFLSFREFPWFADASVRELSLIEVERGHILRWPELDVDLDVHRIEHPERFPLMDRSVRPRPPRAKGGAGTSKRAARKTAEQAPSGRKKTGTGGGRSAR
jgi:hypothetical protein